MARFSSHIRNLTITSIILTLVLVLVAWSRPADSPGSVALSAPLTAADYSWSPSLGEIDIVPGETNKTFPQDGGDLRLVNTGTENETLAISTSDDFPTGSGWSAELNPAASSVTLEPGDERSFNILVSAPDNAVVGDTYTYKVKAISAVGEYQFVLTINVIEPTPTPTYTPTPTAETETVGVNLIVKDSNKDEQSGAPGDTVKYVLVVSNPGSISKNYRIRVVKSCDDEIDGASETLSITSVELDNGQSRDFELYVILPEDATLDSTCRTTVRAEVSDDDTIAKEIVLTTNVYESEDTPTPTRTPTPLGRICKDIYELDNEFDHASTIEVNLPQPHPNPTAGGEDDRRSICPEDDEDWIKFGAVAGKVYTIDIPDMADGIDLSLEMFDEQGNSIAFNDDYFQRDDDDGGPEDIRPRIDSWRAPFDGIYYIRVRDAAGRGGVDRTYTVRVLTESYGPTPITISEVCLDRFEPDGLPEQAALITSNERQKERRLCPTGDADWVTFFGKAGKRYFIYTDTGPYGEDRVNDTEAGADTVLVLTDRDGVSTLDYNDDIPGGNSLDSQIEFNPLEDGFYYLQIKNVGDIGNQFIRYDLVLELCKPGQTDCGRASNPSSRTANRSDGSVVTAVPVAAPTPTIPTEEFSLDATSTPTATPAGTGSQVGDGGTDADDVAYSVAGFADRAFQTIWEHADRPVHEQRVARPWMWGPQPLVSRSETYHQAQNSLRLVQYFDKGRMEINDPTGDPSHPWFVTFGLLADELVNQRIQVGDSEYMAHHAADIVVIGDGNDPAAPTYASFQQIMATPSPNLVGEDALSTIDRNGQVGSYDGQRYTEARLVHFSPATGHNIPQVFWRYLNAHGEVYAQGAYSVGPVVDWTRVVGYPLSEPYWARVTIDGTPHDVLIQVYQRRVLAFAPALPAESNIIMSDIGRHYYQWRYGELLP